MENFSVNSYEPIVFNATTTVNNNLASCRKKLNFNDQTNNINEMTTYDSSNKQTRKHKRNMANSTGTFQINNYKSDQNKTLKIPSNTKRNARERKRVRTINDYFSQLQKFLPQSKQITNSNGTTSTVATSTKKLSKVETLKAAIEYIEYLQTFSPLSNHKGMSLSSSLSSSPLSSSSSNNTTILSPSSSVLTSPSITAASSLNSSMSSQQLSEKLKTTQIKTANSLQTQKQSLKSKLNKTLQLQQQATPIRFDNSDTLSPIAQPIQQQCLGKDQLHTSSINDAILNPIDFNINYNSSNASTNDSYYYNQQQCYNNSNYLQYSSPSSTPVNGFRSEYYMQQPVSNQVNQTSYYPHYGLECDSTVNQLNSSSPSVSSPETRTPPELNHRAVTSAFNNANYVTVNYNHQEQNIMLTNHVSYNNASLIDYHHNQINC